uniref:Uncharacterized protein n=1 Tax=Zea mays TaxID=4577 RepID=A0A804Q3J6_MAIZE
MVGRCADACSVHWSATSAAFHTLLTSWLPPMDASTTTSMSPRARCCRAHWITLVGCGLCRIGGLPVTSSRSTTPKLYTSLLVLGCIVSSTSEKWKTGMYPSDEPLEFQ